jgi:hypothetical protein
LLKRGASKCNSVNNNVWKPLKVEYLNGLIDCLHCCLTMALVSTLKVMTVGYL